MRPPGRRFCGWLSLLLLALSAMAITGCAWWGKEEKKPQTVTEWMKQRRVGEDLK